FLRAAATLICVPEKYTTTLSQLELEITPTRSTSRYNAAIFGPLETITSEAIARYLASIGVSATEAELWRPWAAAYVDMEIVERPNGRHTEGLKKTRDVARTAIDNSPKWVFSSVQHHVLGYYDPSGTRSDTHDRVLDQWRVRRNERMGPPETAWTPFTPRVCSVSSLLAPVINHPYMYIELMYGIHDSTFTTVWNNTSHSSPLLRFEGEGVRRLALLTSHVTVCNVAPETRVFAVSHAAHETGHTARLDQ
ncbi:hypothetical protein BC826DRAFT_678041, partial [Russula brevipes]